jgi:hypothetical protein
MISFEGSRSSALNLEAKSLFTWSTSRQTVVARLQDMTIDQFQEIRAKAGGLIVQMPENVAKLSIEEKQVKKSLIDTQADVTFEWAFTHFYGIFGLLLHVSHVFRFITSSKSIFWRRPCWAVT